MDWEGQRRGLGIQTPEPPMGGVRGGFRLEQGMRAKPRVRAWFW